MAWKLIKKMLTLFLVIFLVEITLSGLMFLAINNIYKYIFKDSLYNLMKTINKVVITLDLSLINDDVYFKIGLLMILFAVCILILTIAPYLVYKFMYKKNLKVFRLLIVNIIYLFVVIPSFIVVSKDSVLFTVILVIITPIVKLNVLAYIFTTRLKNVRKVYYLAFNMILKDTNLLSLYLLNIGLKALYISTNSIIIIIITIPIEIVIYIIQLFLFDKVTFIVDRIDTIVKDTLENK